MMKRILIYFSALILICVSTTASFAEFPPQIKQDFAPLAGVIIMPIGDEYLIDLDVTSGIQQGDILTLISEGEKVIHPVTKEILGTLDVAQGFLQVTRVKSGYSYAKLLISQTPPHKGDQVKRFEQVPSRITDSVPEQLRKELENGLPQLNWLGDTDTTQPILIFSMTGNTLVVSDNKDIPLKRYQYTGGSLSAVTATPSIQNANDPFSLNAPRQEKKSLLNQAVGNIFGSVGLDERDARLEAPGIIHSKQNQAAVWMGPNLDGTPVGITVADFDHDGKTETAIAFESELLIARISQGEFQQIATIDIPTGIKLLSVDSLDLNHDGFPEIFLSGISGNEVNSQIVEFKGGTYQRTGTGIRWFLRVVDIPDKGPILAGQLFGNWENPFSTPVVELQYQDGSLASQGQLDVPKNINVFSFVPFTGTENKELFAYVSTSDFLNISTLKGDNLWESSENFGGSETGFYPAQKQNNTELITPTYIQKRILLLPSGELLTAQNEGPRIFKGYRNFDKSRVVALQWNGFAPQETWRTSDQNGYLADFSVADADNDGLPEIVMVMSFKQGSLFQKGRSTVVIYELNK